MNSFFSRILSWFRRPAASESPVKKPLTFPQVLVQVSLEKGNQGIRETSRNRGPGIEELWTATSYGTAGYRKREPWCATGAAWSVREAARRHFGESAPFRLPRSAAVNDWPRWADDSPVWRRFDPKATKVQPGDIICWDFNGRDEPGGTHIGVAVSGERSDGTYDTSEANTNAEGSREGNGWFIRTTRTRKGVFAILRYVG